MLDLSQIQPQKKIKICLSKNIQNSKFDGLTHAWGEGVGRGYQNKEILKFVPTRLLKSLT